MKFEDHCNESIKIFGSPFEEVHKHRKFRHHRQGLQQVQKLFGESAVPVAMLHIISDLKEEGWKGEGHFPEDELDYVRMGLY